MSIFSCRRFPPLSAMTLAGAAFVATLPIQSALAQRTAARHSPAGYVYTADERGNSLSAIDLTNGNVETITIPVSPHNVQIAPDGTRVLAVGVPVADEHGHSGNDHAEAPGQLLVFDSNAISSGTLAAIPVGEHPAHVVTDQAGKRAFVTLAEGNAVAVVNLADQKVMTTIATGQYPHGLRGGPDGSSIYVANVKDGSVSVLDPERLVEVARIPVGTAPVQLGFLPDGSRAYVSLRDEKMVAVIDTTSRTVLDKIAAGRNPIQVYATPDSRYIYVANQGTETDPADTVSVIDTAAGEVVKTIKTGAGAHGVVVSDDGRFAFVTNIVDGTVSVIDVANQAVIKTFEVGDGPNGVTFKTSL
jgi:YVTN family beta-propeller protein